MQRGRHVIMACRDAEKCAAAKRELDARRGAAAEKLQGSCECAALDLSRPGSIRGFAQQVGRRRQRISLLVNNAGAAPPMSRWSPAVVPQPGVPHSGAAGFRNPGPKFPSPAVVPQP